MKTSLLFKLSSTFLICFIALHVFYFRDLNFPAESVQTRNTKEGSKRVHKGYHETAVRLEEIKLNDSKEIVQHEDYCSTDGGVCAYHDICYSTIKGYWFTSASQMATKSPLLNDMGYSEPFESKQLPIKETNATCNERFVPRTNMPYPSEKELVYQEGTAYLVCCWVNHFGHILLQMFTSAVFALEKIGSGKLLRSESIKFVVDNRASSWGSPETALSLFRFLTKNTPERVFSLQVLEEKAKQEDKDNICFEKLIVGMLNDNLVRGGGSLSAKNGQIPLAPQAQVGMLRPLRGHLENIYPLSKESIELAINETQYVSPTNSKSESKSKYFEEEVNSPPECTITVLQREGAQRVISNFDEVMNTTKEIFSESKWNIRSVSFDGPSLKSQYLTVHSSMVLVSVSGTGSHMAMFLAEGGKSVEILYSNNVVAKNTFICNVSPYLDCLTVETTCRPNKNFFCKNSPTLGVNMKSYKETMEGIKGDIAEKCDIAIGSFLTEE